MTTYTTAQARRRLGLTTRAGFHYLRQTYPGYFVVVAATKGGRPGGVGKQTEYDANKIDELAQLRDQLRSMRK